MIPVSTASRIRRGWYSEIMKMMVCSIRGDVQETRPFYRYLGLNDATQSNPAKEPTSTKRVANISDDILSLIHSGWRKR